MNGINFHLSSVWSVRDSMHESSIACFSARLETWEWCNPGCTAAVPTLPGKDADAYISLLVPMELFTVSTYLNDTC